MALLNYHSTSRTHKMASWLESPVPTIFNTNVSLRHKHNPLTPSPWELLVLGVTWPWQKGKPGTVDLSKANWPTSRSNLWHQPRELGSHRGCPKTSRGQQHGCHATEPSTLLASMVCYPMKEGEWRRRVKTHHSARVYQVPGTFTSSASKNSAIAQSAMLVIFHMRL